MTVLPGWCPRSRLRSLALRGGCSGRGQRAVRLSLVIVPGRMLVRGKAVVANSADGSVLMPVGFVGAGWCYLRRETAARAMGRVTEVVREGGVVSRH